MYMKALEYDLGEQEHDLEDLDDVVQGVRDALREGGLGTYRVTERSIVELSAAPLRRTIDGLTDAERGAVRRLVYATNSVWDPSLFTPEALSGMLTDIGLPGVLPIHVSMSWCANFHSAIELARMLIQSDGDECVLVVCADVWRKDRGRLVQPKVSVHSDAAASFAVTTHGGPFRIDATQMRLDPALGALDRSRQFVQYIDGVARGVVGIVDATLLAGGIGHEEIARLIPNNYSRWVCRSMAEVAGFTEDQLYLDNVERFGHALCADNPINLCDAASGGKLTPGDRLLLLGSGAYQWGCSTVQYVDGNGTA